MAINGVVEKTTATTEKVCISLKVALPDRNPTRAEFCSYIPLSGEPANNSVIFAKKGDTIEITPSSNNSASHQIEFSLNKEIGLGFHQLNNLSLSASRIQRTGPIDISINRPKGLQPFKANVIEKLELEDQTLLLLSAPALSNELFIVGSKKDVPNVNIFKALVGDRFEVFSNGGRIDQYPEKIQNLSLWANPARNEAAKK